MSEKIRSLVNGTLMQKFIGKPVSIFGYVSRVHRTGTAFDLRTTDNVTVTVNLPEPLTDNLEGVVEVMGTCTSKDTITADEFVQFDAQQINDFTVDACNQVTMLLNTTPAVLEADED